MKLATCLTTLTVFLVASNPSLGGADSRKSLAGLTLGVSPDELTSSLNVLTAGPTGRKATVKFIQAFGAPRYPAQISGSFVKDTESIGVNAYFSPPPLPQRLVSLSKASQYKQGVAVAYFKAAIIEKYGPPGLLPEDGQGNGRTIVFWAWSHDGAPIKFSRKVFDDSRTAQRLPDFGLLSISTMAYDLQNGTGIDLDFIEGNAKLMRASGIGICVIADYQAADNIIDHATVTVLDLENSAASLERLAGFIRGAAERKNQQERKNAQEVKPTL